MKEEILIQEERPVSHNMGLNIKIARESAGLKQKELANELDIHVKTMERLETLPIVKDETLYKVSEITGFKFDFLKYFSVNDQKKTNIVENNTVTNTGAEQSEEKISNVQGADFQSEVDQSVTNEIEGIPFEEYKKLNEELTDAKIENALSNRENEELKKKIEELQKQIEGLEQQIQDLQKK